jgi:hypothetical protein
MDGDKVYLDDLLQVYHKLSDCYVNFDETNQPIFLDKQYSVVEFDA